MQPVRKKKLKKPLAARLLILAALLLLGALVWFGLLDKKVPPLISHEEERLSLIQVEEERLLRFEVRSSKGDAFTLVRENDGFVVEGRPDFVLDPLELELMVRDLTVLSANELAGEVHLDEASLAMLGLGREAARVTAHYEGGSLTTLVFGDSAMTEIPSDYLMVEGSNRVYTVSPETRDHFDRELNTLHKIPAINFKPELVREIIMEGRDPFAMSQVEGLWELSSPLHYPAGAQAVAALLNSVGKMRLALYAGKADAETLKKTGLAEPKRTVTFRLLESVITGFDEQGQPAGQARVPEQDVQFSVGGDIGNIGLYLLYDGQVYQASNVSMGFLRDTALVNLLSRNPVTMPINRLERLVIAENGKTRDYRIEMIEQVLPNNTIARDEQGNTLFEPWVTLNGEDVDSEAFLRDYLALMNLGGAGRLPEGYTNDGPPVKTYTFYQHGGTRELALVPYDALHYALRVNGHYVDYVSRAAADALGL